MSSLLALWKRYPSLGLLAALSVVLIPAWLGWTTARVYVPVWTGAQESLADFSFYYDGAKRFLADPLALYPDVYFGYMYPPPSVVLFLPLVLVPLPWALTLSLVGIAGLAVASIVLALDLYEGWRGEPVTRPLRLSLLLIGLATAPVFQNMKYAQVNVLVLFIGLAFLALVRRDRVFAAALVLSAGFWLKLYPIGLALLGLRWEDGLRWGEVGRLAAGFAVGLVGVPLALLPLVPLELYRQYAFDLMPYWATATNMDALVQSIPGVLEHLRQPVSDYLRSHDAILHPVTEVVNTAATLGMLGGLYGAYFAGRLRREVVGVLILAVLPVISVLGWEHTYVLALPLYLFVLLEALRRGPGAQAFAVLGMLVFMLPKLPQPQMVWTFAHWPRPVVDVFYARFLLVTLLFLAVGTAWMWQRKTTRAPAA